MTTITQPEQNIQTLRYAWLRVNRGKLSQIAADLGISHNKVRLTFHGAVGTADPKVTSALAAVGAPGFTAE